MIINNAQVINEPKNMSQPSCSPHIFFFELKNMLLFIMIQKQICHEWSWVCTHGYPDYLTESPVEFDQIVDRMAQTATDDPELMELYIKAMEIWLAELPSIPLVQWYHRIPYNEKYWTNWPTEKNPYMNSAYWHRGWLQVLLNLRPTN